MILNGVMAINLLGQLCKRWLISHQQIFSRKMS